MGGFEPFYALLVGTWAGSRGEYLLRTILHVHRSRHPQANVCYKGILGLLDWVHLQGHICW